MTISDTGLRVSPEGTRDRPHRTPDGRPTDLGLEGVLVERPPRHVDHRGSLFEAISFNHPFWSEPIVHGEWVVAAPGMIKGWGMHLKSVDRYVAGSGRFRVVLHDARVDSPSYGHFAEFHFSDQSPGWLRIPCGVWHATQNYGGSDAIFLNFPTDPHNFEDPDKWRLDPYDRSEIDFDWTVRGG